MNFTIPVPDGRITSQYCTDWCMQQHFTGNYQFMIPLTIGLLCFVVSDMVRHHKDSEVRKYQNPLLWAAYFLTASAMIWFLLI